MFFKSSIYWTSLYLFYQLVIRTVIFLTIIMNNMYYITIFSNIIYFSHPYVHWYQHVVGWWWGLLPNIFSLSYIRSPIHLFSYFMYRYFLQNLVNTYEIFDSAKISTCFYSYLGIPNILHLTKCCKLCLYSWFHELSAPKHMI